MRSNFIHRAVRRAALALGGVAFLAAASTLHAAGIVNGGFETGDFTGWNTYGNTSIQTSTFGTGPTEGNYDALLSSGRSSGTTGNNDSETSTQLATDLGLSSTYFSSQGFTEGSAISQTVTFASASDTLSFAYNFLTNEDNTGLGQPDAALFLVLSSPSGPSALMTLPLGVPTDASLAAPLASGFDFMTGFNTFGPTAITTPGTYTLTFAVLDYGDTFSPSAVLIDDVAVNGSTTGTGGTGGSGGAVPLPASLLLFPLGALLAGGYSLRLRKCVNA